MVRFNKVYIAGNLTRDPEIKHFDSGHTVAQLGVAVSEKYKNREGEWVEQPCFVDVVAWDGQAKACESFLRKGAPVLIEGRLQLDQWETDGGEKRSKMRVRAHRVQFLQGRDRSPEITGDRNIRSRNPR